MRVLFVSYRCPPVVTSESLLIPRTLWAMEQLGCLVTVLSTKEADCAGVIDHKLMDLIPSSIEIIRVRSFERYLASLNSLGYRLLKTFGMFFYSDLWYLGAVGAGRSILRKGGFDIIYSRSSTWISNIVGLQLKRYAKLPWVAHFSDPWVDNPYVFPQYNAIQRRWAMHFEKAIIREADAVVFTNRYTADLAMSKYPELWRERIHVFPHGYDPRVYLPGESNSGQNGPLRLMHAGHFFGDRSPLALFEALRILDKRESLRGKLEVALIGSVAERWRLAAKEMGLQDIVKFYGRLTFAETLQHLGRAHALAVIDADTKEGPNLFLPSKLIDYLPLRKPILGITPFKGASADLLRELECPILAPTDVKGIADQLSYLMQQFQKGCLGLSYNSARRIDDYDIRSVTEKLVNTFRMIKTEERAMVKRQLTSVAANS